MAAIRKREADRDSNVTLDADVHWMAHAAVK